MPGLHTQHPDAEKLTAFGLGRLSEADSKEIEQHLADCAECRNTLDNLPGDSLVSLLQASALASQESVNLAGPSADTDSSSLSKESIPPLYKKLAQIIGGKPAEQSEKTTSPKAPPAATLNVQPGFTAPRELEGHARYLVLAPLGAGGMGTVYKAQHRLMERVVALKIVNQVLVTKPGAVERFTREVKAAAQLVHPNIVTAFDAEKVGEMHLLVMEYVEGRTLAQVILDERELPVAKACDYVRQTALGLQYALSRGMVHRDIKPQNLMLTPTGEIKILDFGLARFVSEQAQSDGSTEHGSLMGSPDYMAPEQAQDAHSADQRADIYSMGCTLYQLLAGQVPFPEASLLTKLEAHRDRQPIPLNHVRFDLPADLAKVVEKMMAKDPAQRYQTPGEVAAALAPFTHGAAVAPQAQGQPSQGLSNQPSHKPIYALVAIAACLLFLGFGYWLTQIVFRVETSEGTLIIKTNDPDLQLSVKKGGKEVALIFTKEKKEIPLKIGDYTVELVGAKEGLKLKTNSFRIESGKGKTVEVEFVPAPVAQKKDPPKGDSVEELLKTREVLTVAQDGGGAYRTIQAALDALQPGQVIHVKDKGPYRELLRKELPPNVAMISKVGTRIDIPKFEAYDEAPEKGKFWYRGSRLTAQGGFHLSGFELTGSHERPADLIGGMMFQLDVAGDVIIENCSLQGPTFMTGLTITGLGKPASVLAQDNLANQAMEFHPFPGMLTIQHNWITNTHAALYLNQNNGSCIVRHNVIQSESGIFYNLRSQQEKIGTDSVDLQIYNNVIETTNGPIVFYQAPKDSLLPRSARIVNNVIRSRVEAGIVGPIEIAKALKDICVIGPNVYQSEPKAMGALPLIAKGIGNVITTTHFLSVEPAQANFFRIAADGPLAKGGTGEDLPTYFGAFPPGPAPKEGDWFTRLQKVAKRSKTLPIAKTPFAWPADALREGRITAPDVSKAKLLHKDEFEDPKSGWHRGPSWKGSDSEYENGCYFIRHENGGHTNAPRWQQVDNFACEVVGRVNGKSESDRWGLVLFKKWEDKSGIRVMLDRDGGLEVAPAGLEWEPFAGLPSGIIRHYAIRKGDAFNTLLVVVRGQRLEVYVNGVAVCDPIPFDRNNMPCNPHLSLISQAYAKAEYDRINIWSADGLPTPEEQMKKGEVPVKVAPTIPFAWPVDALREGRITAPDLNKAKVLYMDAFDDPKSGWPQGGDAGASMGYKNGRYFIRHEAGGIHAWNCPANPHSNFACEVVGRINGPRSHGWGWSVANGQDPKRVRGIKFRLTGEGKLDISPNDFETEKNLEPKIGPMAHAAIKGDTEFNRLLVVVRGRRVEVYVNSIAVCDPFIVDRDINPGSFSFWGFGGEKAGQAEFARITVWSADGMPTPEERLKNGEVPLKEAPKAPFVWPVDALREGRITAPDLSKIKPRFQDDFSDPKSGWRQEKIAPDKDNFSMEFGYDKGKYVIQLPTSGGQGGTAPPWGKQTGYKDSNYAVTVVGRLASPAATWWEAGVFTSDSTRNVQFKLTSNGKMEIRFSGQGWTRLPLVQTISHPAIKKADDFNAVTLLVRDRILEVYVNSIAVCDPIVLEQPITPGYFGIGGGGEKGARLEFQRATLWSAESIATPEDRLKNGEVPVKKAQ